jgi:hypothetical protein
VPRGGNLAPGRRTSRSDDLDRRLGTCHNSTTTVHEGFPLDVLACRPDDVERREREDDPLVREALDRGRTRYERRS